MYLPGRIRTDTVALISIDNLSIPRFTCTFEHQDLEVMFVRLPANLFINFNEFIFIRLVYLLSYSFSELQLNN